MPKDFDETQLSYWTAFLSVFPAQKDKDEPYSTWPSCLIPNKFAFQLLFDQGLLEIAEDYAGFSKQEPLRRFLREQKQLVLFERSLLAARDYVSQQEWILSQNHEITASDAMSGMFVPGQEVEKWLGERTWDIEQAVCLAFGYPPKTLEYLTLPEKSLVYIVHSNAPNNPYNQPNTTSFLTHSLKQEITRVQRAAKMGDLATIQDDGVCIMKPEEFIRWHKSDLEAAGRRQMAATKRRFPQGAHPGTSYLVPASSPLLAYWEKNGVDNPLGESRTVDNKGSRRSLGVNMNGEDTTNPVITGGANGSVVTPQDSVLRERPKQPNLPGLRVVDGEVIDIPEGTRWPSVHLRLSDCLEYLHFRIGDKRREYKVHLSAVHKNLFDARRKMHTVQTDLLQLFLEEPSGIILAPERGLAHRETLNRLQDDNRKEGLREKQIKLTSRVITSGKDFETLRRQVRRLCDALTEAFGITGKPIEKQCDKAIKGVSAPIESWCRRFGVAHKSRM